MRTDRLYMACEITKGGGGLQHPKHPLNPPLPGQSGDYTDSDAGPP